MPETENERRIREVYEKEAGLANQVFETLNDGKDKKAQTIVKMEEVRTWFRNNREKLKTPKKHNTNSYVAPGPGHVLQIDMFHFEYKQPDKQKVIPEQPPVGPRVRVNRAEIRSTTVVAPFGLMAVDVFTKKMHVVP